MKLISIAVEQDPDRQTRNTVQTGLFDAMFVAARDSHVNLIGGLVGEAYGGWISFTAVWVRQLSAGLMILLAPEAGRVGLLRLIERLHAGEPFELSRAGPALR
ncbi:hypothetical protein LNV08_14040 [Paucibacter sp. TC2R-5]|uniref:hypothetical protein n=1 Tax=Paucibacter sp. TC2R-5 TaxID=2893555 RepID=UPI0021E44AD4|nr:hypothetical protein [Paucibacter sp. TC2R-5]MCV2360095.1 hypothetical protein [Paucibacter sp. TC2R-5]